MCVCVYVPHHTSISRRWSKSSVLCACKWFALFWWIFHFLIFHSFIHHWHATYSIYFWFITIKIKIEYVDKRPTYTHTATKERENESLCEKGTSKIKGNQFITNLLCSSVIWNVDLFATVTHSVPLRHTWTFVWMWSECENLFRFWVGCVLRFSFVWPQHEESSIDLK